MNIIELQNKHLPLITAVAATTFISWKGKCAIAGRFGNHSDADYSLVINKMPSLST
jgi:hypothetical protein